MYGPLNYRPISLNSVCSKVMERVVVKKLMKFLDDNCILSVEQYGFRPGRSVEDQLLVTYSEVSKWIDCGHCVDVVLFDFSKAFDRVCHSVLIDKLYAIGVRGCLLAWLMSFLSGRSMRVSVSGSFSGLKSVTSGVPQGSVLGPLLFLIYVNDLPFHIRSKCKVFADDFKIYLSAKLTNPVEATLHVLNCQRDINTLIDVSRSWGLEMNVDKCSVMRFQRKFFDWDLLGVLGCYYIEDSPISFAADHKDLGVLVDNNLKFHKHIQCITNKAGGMASNFLRSTVCRSREFMLSLYITHIRPLIEFSSCVWNTGYVGDLKLLESVQRRWTRHIEGLENVNYSD